EAALRALVVLPVEGLRELLAPELLDVGDGVAGDPVHVGRRAARQAPDVDLGVGHLAGVRRVVTGAVDQADAARGAGRQPRHARREPQPPALHGPSLSGAAVPRTRASSTVPGTIVADRPALVAPAPGRKPAAAQPRTGAGRVSGANDLSREAGSVAVPEPERAERGHPEHHRVRLTVPGRPVGVHPAEVADPGAAVRLGVGVDRLVPGP